MYIRTCKMKHFCEREFFNQRGRIYKGDCHGYEFQFELVEDHSHDDNWDQPNDPYVTILSSDIRDEVVHIYQSKMEESTHHNLYEDNDGNFRLSSDYLGKFFIRVNGICKVCTLYDKRQSALKYGKIPLFYIIAYGISRYCFSKAEGGCWADWVTIHEVRRAFTFKQGLHHLRELKEQYPQPKYNRFSCANRGEDDNMFVLCYDEKDPRWPVESTKRAQYE